MSVYFVYFLCIYKYKYMQLFIFKKNMLFLYTKYIYI